jgi:hypothetical protein
MALNRVELLLGWLAVILAGAVAAYAYFGGYIAPDSVQSDLIGVAVILLTLALGLPLMGCLASFRPECCLDWQRLPTAVSPP